MSFGGGWIEDEIWPPSMLLRLKRSVELFPGSEGDLYLLRLGLGDDQVIEQPGDRDRALLHRLAAGFSAVGDLESDLGPEIRDSLRLLMDLGVLEARPASRPLSPVQAERYDRQLIYLADLTAPGASADELQERLGEAHVLIVGCGGLGSWTATGLSLSGIGRLTLVDDDSVELSNLSRQLLFEPTEIGRSKADIAAARLRAHNPELEVDAVHRRISCADDFREILDGLGDSGSGDPDLIVSTGDWPPHDLPRWVNEVAWERRIPWLGAGQFPPRLRVGPLMVPGMTACQECMESWARGISPLYDEVAEFRGTQSLPDASTGPASGVIGSLLANEVVHFVAGAEPASLGHALMFDMRTFSAERQELAADPSCRVCGVPAAAQRAMREG